MPLAAGLTSQWEITCGRPNRNKLLYPFLSLITVRRHSRLSWSCHCFRHHCHNCWCVCFVGSRPLLALCQGAWGYSWHKSNYAKHLSFRKRREATACWVGAGVSYLSWKFRGPVIWEETTKEHQAGTSETPLVTQCQQVAATLPRHVWHQTGKCAPTRREWDESGGAFISIHLLNCGAQCYFILFLLSHECSQKVKNTPHTCSTSRALVCVTAPFCWGRAFTFLLHCWRV